MRTTKIFTLLMVTATIIFMDACKGEKGDIGPAGANGTNGTNGAIGSTGQTGATGATGSTGQTGATGATGTANVIYGNWIDMNNASFWYRLPSASQTNSSGQSNNGFGCNFAAPITQDILDKALVFVYGKYHSASPDKNVYLLPASFYTEYSVEAFVGLGRIYIQNVFPLSNRVGSNTTYTITSCVSQFRYIIVPGSINGRKAAIDYSDYEAVKAYYNLKD